MRLILLCVIFLTLLPVSWINAQSVTEKVELVHRRVLFGSAGQQPLPLQPNKGWIELARLYSPFGSAAPTPKENALRKWRLYAVYWDPFVETPANIELKFVFPDTQTQPQAKLPQIASQEEGLRADGYSDWFQFGNGTANEIHLSNGTCYAQFLTHNSSFTTARIYWLELLAYDISQVEEYVIPPHHDMVDTVITPVEEPITPLIVEETSVVTLVGKVVHKSWSKSMESWLAGGSDYCILEVDPSVSQTNPFEGTIYLRPSQTINLMQIAKYSGGTVQVMGILDIPAEKPPTPEDRFSQRPADTIGPDGRVIRSPQSGSGKGILVEHIDFYAPKEVPPVIATYTLQGTIVLEVPKKRKKWSKTKFYLDFTNAYTTEAPPMEGPISLLPSKEVSVKLLTENANRFVEVTGTLDPNDPKSLIVSRLQNVEPPAKTVILRGKVVQKYWSKSMESWLAGGSDYCILDTAGFYNAQNPVVGTIYLRPSDKVSYVDIRQYAGKTVEIVGIHDVPARKFLNEEDEGQHPIEFDINGNQVKVSKTAAAGSGEGIRVYEIRVVQ